MWHNFTQWVRTKDAPVVIGSALALVAFWVLEATGSLPAV